MEAFHYQHGELFCETIPVEDVARRYGSPVIIYSAAALRANLRAVREAFADISPEIRFPVSTLPSPGVLRLLTEEGCGMAAVSGGELERAWLSKARMSEVHFAGVGKSDDDIRAALDGIYSPLFQAGVTVDGRPPYYRGPTGWLIAESLNEIERIATIAGSLRVNCRIAVRLNTALEVPADEPVPDADTNSKFGVPPSIAVEAFRRFEFRQHVRLAGLASHVGPRSLDVRTYTDGIRRLTETASVIRAGNHEIELLCLGGGLPALGVSQSTPPLRAYADAIAPLVEPWRDAGLTFQPGLPIAASAGLLVVSVREIKPTDDPDLDVVICDTGLDPAGRPAEIDGCRVVWPITTEPGLEPPRPGVQRLNTSGLRWYNLVGPSGRDLDTIAMNRSIPRVVPGDRLAIFAAGACARGTVASGNDQIHPAEVLVEGRNMIPLRPRAGLIEQLAPELGPLEKL